MAVDDYHGDLGPKPKRLLVTGGQPSPHLWPLLGRMAVGTSTKAVSNPKAEGVHRTLPAVL